MLLWLLKAAIYHNNIIMVLCMQCILDNSKIYMINNNIITVTTSISCNKSYNVSGYELNVVL